MIKSIHVKNYILIDDLTVDFSDGLNVIAGETGAGKSILINAVDIAFGAKISSDVIKKGTEKALIELFITTNNPDIKILFEENGIDYDDEIVISREILQSSSRIRINGTLVNQTVIKDFREILLDIHSQHQTYSFLQPKSHIILLDNYAKDVYGAKLEEYKEKYKEYQNLLKELDFAKNASNATESQIDFLKFQINEIEEAKIYDGEFEEISESLNRISNSEKVINCLNSLNEILSSHHYKMFLRRDNVKPLNYNLENIKLYTKNHVLDIDTNENFFKFNKSKINFCIKCKEPTLFDKTGTKFIKCLNCFQKICKYCMKEYDNTHLDINIKNHCKVYFRIFENKKEDEFGFFFKLFVQILYSFISFFMMFIAGFINVEKLVRKMLCVNNNNKKNCCCMNFVVFVISFILFLPVFAVICVSYAYFPVFIAIWDILDYF